MCRNCKLIKGSFMKKNLFSFKTQRTESNLKMCYYNTLCAFSACASEELAATSECKLTACYTIKQMQISPEQKLVLNKEMVHLFRTSQGED